MVVFFQYIEEFASLRIEIFELFESVLATDSRTSSASPWGEMGPLKCP
jgi:hypothetical protein